MVSTMVQTPGAISRNRFMLGVLTAGGAAIALTYIGVIARYLYPKRSGSPPLKVGLSEAGVAGY